MESTFPLECGGRATYVANKWSHRLDVASRISEQLVEVILRPLLDWTKSWYCMAHLMVTMMTWQVPYSETLSSNTNSWKKIQTKKILPKRHTHIFDLTRPFVLSRWPSCPAWGRGQGNFTGSRAGLNQSWTGIVFFSFIKIHISTWSMMRISHILISVRCGYLRIICFLIPFGSTYHARTLILGLKFSSMV